MCTVCVPSQQCAQTGNSTLSHITKRAATLKGPEQEAQCVVVRWRSRYPVSSRRGVYQARVRASSSYRALALHITRNLKCSHSISSVLPSWPPKTRKLMQLPLESKADDVVTWTILADHTKSCEENVRSAKSMHFLLACNHSTRSDPPALADILALGQLPFTHPGHLAEQVERFAAGKPAKTDPFVLLGRHLILILQGRPSRSDIFGASGAFVA